jgi:site-specific DNA-methyltransferase (adenine-specific)
MIYNEDCLDKLKELDDNSVDSIVTDPPYGLSFMGKKWDYDVPSQEIWEECYRVLKSGGHLLAFAGSRTYHRMAVRIEDAGFEIRDQIMWVYGSGFPKSHNIGKAVDKLQGNKREVIGTKGLNSFKGTTMRNHYGNYNKSFDEVNKLDRGNSPYEGWGTALKPAHEPIVMARKPFKGSVAQNVLEWGTGGINIDESRIPYKSKDDMEIRKNTHRETNKLGDGNFGGGKYSQPVESGRFPANIIFDEEAGKILDAQTGKLKSGNMPGKYKGWGKNGIYGSADNELEHTYYGDTGGASRFFYCPKTSKRDRNEGLEDFEGKQVGTLNANSSDLENYGGSSLGASSLKGDHKPPQPKQNFHPTVKPTDLMLYLIRLVTPKGGTTLDPFMGSGSTGKAAVRGGFDFIGIEREKEYIEIAKARIKYEQEKQKPDSQIKLF